jgi:uncharacterized membrane protein YhaH (DUF805 family)
METRVIRGGTTIKLGDHLRARWNRTTKFTLAAFLVVITAIAILSGAPRFETPLEAAIYGLSLFGTVILFFLFWVALMVAIAAIFAMRLSKAQRAITYEIGPDAVSMRDETGTTVMTAWSIIRRATESSAAYRLYTRPMGMRYIPKRAFAAGDLAALRALLIEKLGTAANLRKS